MTEKKVTKKVAAKVKAMENKYGIKETKEMLQFIFAIVKIVVEAKRNDGVIGPSDLALLINLFPHIGPAFDGIQEIVNELKDLDEAEIKELITFSAAHLGSAFTGGNLEDIINKSLTAAIAIVDLVVCVMNQKKK